MSEWPKRLRVGAVDAQKRREHSAAQLLREAADYIERLEKRPNDPVKQALRMLFIEYLLIWDHKSAGTSNDSIADGFMSEVSQMLAMLKYEANGEPPTPGSD